jgi:Zonular occludens toxin (Zot)
VFALPPLSGASLAQARKFYGDLSAQSTTTTTSAAARRAGVVTAHLDKAGTLVSFHMALRYLVPVMAVGGLLIVVASFAHRRQTKGDFGAPGLYGIRGRMGAGKSYLLAHVGVFARKAKRAVYSNFTLSGAERYSSWAELLVVPEGSVVLMDEAHLWFPSEAWRCPVDVMAWLSQLRKRGITMLWASQHEEFVGRRLRRLTFGYWRCRNYRAGHQYTLFDAEGFGTAKEKRLARMYVKRKAEVMAAYDTKEIVGASVEWGDGRDLGTLASSSSPVPAGPAPAQRSGGAGRPAGRGLVLLPDSRRGGGSAAGS